MFENASKQFHTVINWGTGFPRRGQRPRDRIPAILVNWFSGSIKEPTDVMLLGLWVLEHHSGAQEQPVLFRKHLVLGTQPG